MPVLFRVRRGTTVRFVGAADDTVREGDEGVVIRVARRTMPSGLGNTPPTVPERTVCVRWSDDEERWVAPYDVEVVNRSAS
jgi:hypothetical protein